MICPRCGGSGWLLKPIKEPPKKLLNFKKCWKCKGRKIISTKKK